MHCISYALKKKGGKPLFFKQTLRSRLTCLARLHFGFQAKKSLDLEKPFSLALRVVSLFSCLARLAPSVVRFACLTHFARRTKKKERRLVVYGGGGKTIEIWWWWWREREKLFYLLEKTTVKFRN